MIAQLTRAYLSVRMQVNVRRIAAGRAQLMIIPQEIDLIGAAQEYLQARLDHLNFVSQVDERFKRALESERQVPTTGVPVPSIGEYHVERKP